MKKIASIVGVLIALGTGQAFAQQGINMAWDDCLGFGGLRTKTIACTNSGVIANNLMVSFISATDLPMVAAAEAQIDVQTETTMQPWWLQGATRWGGGSGGSSCEAWFMNAPNGPIGFAPQFQNNPGGRPNRIRITESVVVAAGEEQALLANTEYHALFINLKYGAGTAANPGCLQAACICVVNLTMFQPAPHQNLVLENPSTDMCAHWRTPSPAGDCPDATPVRKATWGSIKALYR